MSLLEKATLITTPTAQSEGKLHSIKGGSVADFDVVRGSAATRVNAEGLIEDISTLSGELVTNGDFATDVSGWSGNTTKTWDNGTLVSVGSGAGNNTNIQSLTLTAGKTYRFTWEILSTDGSGSFVSTSSDGQITNSYVGVGTFTEDVTLASSSVYVDFRVSGVNATTIFNSLSVVEVIDATNIPRIDYTTGEGVVLLEPLSTNSITHSEDFSDASWTNIDVSIESGYLAPDGTNSAQKVTSTGTQSHLYVYPAGGTIGKYKSIYARTLSGTGTVNLCNHNSDTNALFTITEQWQRFDILHSGVDLFYAVDFRGASTLSEVVLWGAQIEALSYATSYIPTSGAIATRLADSVTGAGDVNTFNSTEGVLYFEAERLSLLGDKRTISISDGSLNNYLYIQFQGVSNTIRIFYKSVEDGQVLLLNHNLTSTIEFGKYAFRWSDNNFSLWINGVKELEQLSGGTTSSNVFNQSDFSLSNGADKFFGKVKALAVFNEALTDSELECLTKI